MFAGTSGNMKTQNENMQTGTDSLKVIKDPDTKMETIHIPRSEKNTKLQAADKAARCQPQAIGDSKSSWSDVSNY